jgi:hypothetical protein
MQALRETADRDQSAVRPENADQPLGDRLRRPAQLLATREWRQLGIGQRHFRELETGIHGQQQRPRAILAECRAHVAERMRAL